MDNIRQHFALRSSIYNTHCGWVKQTDLLQAIANAIGNVDHKIKILDLGAGTGAISNYLYDSFGSKADIFALDISIDMLSKITNPSIHKIEGTAEYLPFEDNYFDFVVSRQCLHYVDKIDTAIEEIFRVLKNDGNFILSQIVPIENDSLQHWINFTRFRQPLRKTFFSEKEWIEVICKHGFSLINITNHSHRGSMNRWIKQYRVTSIEEINTYKNYFINSSELFKHTYEVDITDADIQNTAFWSTLKFSK